MRCDSMVMFTQRIYDRSGTYAEPYKALFWRHRAMSNNKHETRIARAVHLEAQVPAL